MLTFGDCKTDRGIMRVASYDPNSADFAQLINSSIRMAMRRGDFPGTLVPIYLCVRSGCVIWPYFVGNVRAMSACQWDFKPENMWGGFLPRGRGAPWRNGLRWLGGCESQNLMVSQGRSSVYQDIQGDGRLVRAYFRCNQDLGKTITIFGLDNNGQQLQHLDLATQSWLPGLVLTLQAPFVSTSNYVRSIDYVILDQMQCPVNLYAYNATTNLLEDIAQYEPGETRPSFERAKISNPTWLGIPANSGSCGSCCSGNMGVAALVKLRFRPVKFDTDIVPIDNLEALQMLVQAQKFGEAGDRANKQAFLLDAVAELNRQLEDEEPDQQFAASNEVFGPGVGFANHCF